MIKWNDQFHFGTVPKYDYIEFVGKVVDRKGNGVGFVPVFIHDKLNNEFEARTKTDQNGNFAVSWLTDHNQKNLKNAESEWYFIATVETSSSKIESSETFLKVRTLGSKKDLEGTLRLSNEQESLDYSSKSKELVSIYEKKIQSLKNGIQTSVSSLSGLVYGNTEAKKKIDEAWKYKYTAEQSLKNAEKKLKDSKLEINNHNFKMAYEKLSSIESDTASIEKDLKWISKKIDDAKKLAKPKTCFLFWCW